MLQGDATCCKAFHDAEGKTSMEESSDLSGGKPTLGLNHGFF